MANELEIENAIPARYTYCLLKNSAGKFWNGTTFINYLTESRSALAVQITELGTASGIYQGDFPTDITTGGTYRYIVYQCPDGVSSPSESDDAYGGGGTVDWNGTEAVDSGGDDSASSAGSDWLTYVKQNFKRDDKDTEILEATTDAIKIMRRKFGFDEAEVEVETTDTIAALGDYKIDLESDFGLLMGLKVEESNTGTPLKLITKAQFDEKYPGADVDNNTGFPRHFCLFHGQILIGPVPDRTSYVYRLAYSTRGGIITAASTSIPFTALYRDVLRNCVLWQLYIGLEKWDSAASYKTLFDEGFADAMDRERRNRGTGTFLQVPFSL